MKYPVHLIFTDDLFCQATFPDHPGIVVAGPDPSSTMEKATMVLIDTLSNLLKSDCPVQMPSTCRLGQQLISIPEEMAIRIQARHNEYLTKMRPYPLRNDLT